MVTLLLEWGLDIEREGRCRTPLRAVSLMGHESTVRILLNRGANVNTHGSLGDAIQAASTKGHVSITRVLLQEGANVGNQGGAYGNALQAAAFHGHRKVVELLLDSGAKLHQLGICKDAFHATAQGGQEGVARQLLESGFKFDQQSPGSLGFHGFDRYTNLLCDASPSRIKNHADSSKPGDKSEFASTSDYNTIFRMLKNKRKTNVHEDNQLYQKPLNSLEDNYALAAAASKGHVSIVRIILEHWNSLDMSAHGAGYALLKASTNGHEQVVKCFVTSK